MANPGGSRPPPETEGMVRVTDHPRSVSFGLAPTEANHLCCSSHPTANGRISTASVRSAGYRRAMLALNALSTMQGPGGVARS